MVLTWESAPARQLPALAPRPVASSPVAASAGSPGTETVMHTGEEDWAAAYPHIERMYMRERRKLRYVMKRMEEQYNFRASIQMYKKRFAKWGFHKNVRRSHPTAAAEEASHKPCTNTPCSAADGRNVTPRTTELARLKRQTKPDSGLAPSSHDTETMAFLANIQTWSSVFFDLTQRHDDTTGSACSTSPRPLSYFYTDMSRTYNPEQLSYSFRLISSLIKRGNVTLAGRLARKAFLQTESLLQVQGPLFVWNVLEILYSMVTERQTKLCEMLLGYLAELAIIHYPDSHPVVRLLRSLRGLIRSSKSRGSGPFRIEILERGWGLNADIILNRFQPQFLLLYYHLVWDSSLLKIPHEGLRRIDKQFQLLDGKVPAENDFLAQVTNAQLEPNIRSYENIYSLSNTNHGEINLPKNYQSLRLEALASIINCSTLDLQDQKTELRVLSGLLKSRIIQDSDPPCEWPSGDNSEEKMLLPAATRYMLTRLRARVLVFILRVLMEVDSKLGKSSIGPPVDRLRDIIALRKFAQSPTDPQVVYDLWDLEELLLQEGRLVEAEEARRESFMLLERYLTDIPAHSVYIPAI
ncbi:hypothetical protein BX600DRAFT_457190 [Xylariales sp. PMI_506]|nr:hypothetical protein BX600DRAFT_457190 [Xylariales sp. PMI_506]